MSFEVSETIDNDNTKANNNNFDILIYNNIKKKRELEQKVSERESRIDHFLSLSNYSRAISHVQHTFVLW